MSPTSGDIGLGPPRAQSSPASALDVRGAADRVAQRIRERMLSAELLPGDALREAELAERFGVSRNTVREALRLLTSAGLAIHEKHRGVSVRSFSPGEVHDVLKLRELLELPSAQRAGTLGGEELAGLELPLNRSERGEHEGDLREVLVQNLEFHKAIVALQGNRRLLLVFTGLLEEIGLMLASLEQNVAGHWMTRNRELLDTLRHGDAPAADLILRQYLRTSRDEVVAALDALR